MREIQDPETPFEDPLNREGRVRVRKKEQFSIKKQAFQKYTDSSKLAFI